MDSKISNMLRMEEVAQFILSIIIFSRLGLSWWLYPACLLLPDISMLGYLFGNKTGAYIYNIFHHKMIAVLLIAVGAIFQNIYLIFSGTILFGHSAMDRSFGYGFKLIKGFKFTHLGIIGKSKSKM